MHANPDWDVSGVTSGGLWYFAHPYTRRTKDGKTSLAAENANFILACTRSGELIRRGFNIYSPIAHTHPIHFNTPALLAAEEHELWYQLDNEVIDCTNFKGIILPPEWETSTGCKAEKERITGKGGLIRMYVDLIDMFPILDRLK